MRETDKAATSRGRDAFDEWFDAILPRVLAVARRTTGSDADAEDVASEALARAYARWSSIETSDWRDAWVLRTAINVAIDAGRKRHRFPWHGAVQLSQGRMVQFENQVADASLLATALARLSARQRDAVTLHYLADMSVEDTARAMNVGNESVRTHLSRGLQSLRTTLGSN